MKNISLILILSAFIVLGQSTLTQPQREPARLYIHLYTPPGSTTSGSPISGIRLITMQVYVSEDFYAAVGLDSKTLAGRIEAKGDKFFATLDGKNRSSTGFFKGDIELEEPVFVKDYAISGTLNPFYFVLSHNADCGSFLIKQPAQSQPK